MQRMSTIDSVETSQTIETHKRLDIVWRNVLNECKHKSNKLIQHKQNEESRRHDFHRQDDLKNYLLSLNDICMIKSSNSVIGQKLRCYIPKEFFEKRIAQKTLDTEDDRKTSLDVHVPLKPDDPISKQSKYRRGAMFKKFFQGQDGLNLVNIPMIEEDASDLVDLLDIANNRPMYQEKTGHSHAIDELKLPYLLELEEKPKAGILVSYYVKDHILKLPMLIPDAKRIRELYTNCIIKDEHLDRLFTRRRDMLPKDLLDYIADFGTDNEIENNQKIVKDEIADRDQFFHTSINVYASDILREIEVDSLEFSVFIKPCYILHFSRVMPDIALMGLHDSSKIESTVLQLIDSLNEDIVNPVSKSRVNFMSALMAANVNHNVGTIFSDHLPAWLSAIAKGLFSVHNPVREECCFCIGFLFTQTKFLYNLLNVHTSEFIYEIMNIIFRAMEHYPTSFEFFYSLIGYIMDGCPILTILQCICDKGPYSKNYMMRKRWPKFIVFACKHWPNETFIDGQYSLKKIQDLLEKSFLHSITYKTSKMALAYMGRRFERKSMTVTHWTLNKVGPLTDDL